MLLNSTLSYFFASLPCGKKVVLPYCMMHKCVLDPTNSGRSLDEVTIDKVTECKLSSNKIG